MGTQIQSWQIKDGELQEIDTTLTEQGRTEAYDLETWIESNPTIIGQGLEIIGRQVQTQSGPLDLLGIDRSGNMVIVELKRDMLPREALAQAIDYAIGHADENDIVLVAGKGHENYQEVNGKRYPFSDLTTVQQYLGVNA